MWRNLMPGKAIANDDTGKRASALTSGVADDICELRPPLPLEVLAPEQVERRLPCEPRPGADFGRDVAEGAQSQSRCGKGSPVPLRMWQGCGRGEPSPGADVAGVSPVPVQMWQG